MQEIWVGTQLLIYIYIVITNYNIKLSTTVFLQFKLVFVLPMVRKLKKIIHIYNY